MCLVAVLATLPAAQAAAHVPPGPQDASDGVEADRVLLIDRIDPERLRQIRSERTRQYILGLGLLAAGGAAGFSKQNWVVDEGAIGYAIAALGVAAFIEPMTWRDLEVRQPLGPGWRCSRRCGRCGETGSTRWSGTWTSVSRRSTSGGPSTSRWQKTQAANAWRRWTGGGRSASRRWDRRIESAEQHNEAAHAAICESIAKLDARTRADAVAAPALRRPQRPVRRPLPPPTRRVGAVAAARSRLRRRLTRPWTPRPHARRRHSGADSPAERRGRDDRPAGVLAANAPDGDAVTMFVSRDLSLGFRRGWTHGVLAMAVLPLVLTVPASARPGGGAVGAGRRHGRSHCCS